MSDNDVCLPEIPDYEHGLNPSEIRAAMRDYARRAILADRERQKADFAQGILAAHTAIMLRAANTDHREYRETLEMLAGDVLDLSPDHAATWKSGHQMYQEGLRDGRRSGADRERSTGEWQAEREILIIERDVARARFNRAAAILGRIHGLTNPPDWTVDGKTFRFNNPNANAQLHALSERIRAIPDEIEAARAALGDGQ